MIRPTQSVSVGSSQSVQLTGSSPHTTYAPGSSALLKNTGSATVYLGDASVTSATGFPWATTDGSLSFDLGTGEAIYGICASGTSSTVAVLETAV